MMGDVGFNLMVHRRLPESHDVDISFQSFKLVHKGSKTNCFLFQVQIDRWSCLFWKITKIEDGDEIINNNNNNTQRCKYDE